MAPIRSLDVLVKGGLLSGLPLDMFSREPLKYSAMRGLLWSVGPNGVEDGTSALDEEGLRKRFVWLAPILKGP